MLRSVLGIGTKTQKPSIRKRRFLQLDPLEDRRLLAVLVSTFDDNVIPNDEFTSLREAISIARDNVGDDVILLPAGEYRINSELLIDDPSGRIQIQSLDGLATIFADSVSRVFLINSGSQVQLDSLALVGGSADVGGAIFNLGDLTTNSTAMIGNRATFAGGAIYNLGSVAIVGGVFAGNQATVGDGGVIHSGAGSLLSFVGSEVSDNSAATNGGAIFAEGATLRLQDIQLLRNRSNSGGGGIFVTNGSALEIRNSDLIGNETLFAGGAVFNFASALTIHDSRFEQNKVLVQDGGAISILGNSNAEITDAIFASNQANDEGGAIYLQSSSLELIDSILESNLAGRNGGALHLNNNAAAILVDSVLRQNYSVLAGGATFAESSTIDIYDSYFIQNATMTEEGGAIALRASAAIVRDSVFLRNTSNVGGALYIDATSVAVLTDSMFRHNVSLADGGAIYSRGALFMTDVRLVANGAGRNGGAVYLESGSTNIVQSRFSANRIGQEGLGQSIFVAAAATLSYDFETIFSNPSAAIYYA